MFKRKTEGGGDERPTKEQKTEVIPRHIPSNCITIPFRCRTWEEIAPGACYYLPLQQNPFYMLDTSQLNLFNKYRELWHTMVIHTPQARVTNLIMLQDDLRVQNSTPTDATAFTQVCYLMKYSPRGQKQYFKLSHTEDPIDLKSKPLSYKLKPLKAEANTSTQLIKMVGFEDFEKLSIQGARANKTAGFIPGTDPEFDTDKRLLDPYIAPNGTTSFKDYSGNLNPPPDDKYFLKPGQTLTMCKNQDKIKFYKYGDTFNIPINTNIEGMHLANHPHNDFTKINYIEVSDPTTKKKYKYQAEFAWPSRNRPFLSRDNYYNENIDPITHGKNFKPLCHDFIMMPPIKKPNGSLLGQRVSCILEQSFAVTLYFNQGTFGETLEEDALQVNQDNQIILRPNIYPVPDVTDMVDSIYCPRPYESICLPPPPPICYPDNFVGFSDFLMANPLHRDLNSFCTFTNSSTGNPDSVFMRMDLDSNAVIMDLGDLPKYKIFKQKWIEALNKPSGQRFLYLYWEEGEYPPTMDIGGVPHYIYAFVNTDFEYWCIAVSTSGGYANQVQINVEKLCEMFLLSKANRNSCKVTAQAPVANTLSTVFFV